MPNTSLKLIPSPSFYTSPYHVYLQSLSPSGRRSMASLLNTCTTLLGYPGKAEDFDWSSFSYAKAMMIRNAMLQSDYAINTINMAISALKGVVKTAFNLELVDADRLGRINALKPVRGDAQKRPGRVLSKEEINALLTACEAYPSAISKRNHALLLTALNTGLRCSEISALTLANMDLQNRRLLICNGKGRKQRVGFINEKVKMSLEDWLAARDTSPGPLFVRIHKGDNITSTTLSTNGIVHILNDISQRANVNAFSPHDLRRTFITHLLEKNIDLNTVRQIAGHSVISTTIRYDKRSESVYQAYLEKVNVEQ